MMEKVFQLLQNVQKIFSISAYASVYTELANSFYLNKTKKKQINGKI